MVIREYHKNNGDIIVIFVLFLHPLMELILLAVMAGMKVIVVKCDEKGNIDFEDLKDKAEEHSQNLAA